MPIKQKITTYLWFDNQAEEAMNFYVSIFKNSKVLGVTRYGEAGPGPKGSVMIGTFQLEGQQFIALNGGPHFKFNEAISLQIMCKSQEEIDRYWEKLGAGGDPKAQVCGWLKDKYGLSWQVAPEGMEEMYADVDSPGASRVMEAMLKMKKLDMEALKEAYEGETARR